MKAAQLFLLGATVLVLSAAGSAFAGSATWLTSPVNGNWNSALNWSPMTVPDGPADTATFGSSSKTNVSASEDTEVNGIVFNPGASAFTISAGPGTPDEPPIPHDQRCGHHQQLRRYTKLCAWPL